MEPTLWHDTIDGGSGSGSGSEEHDDEPWSRIRHVFSIKEQEGACHADHLAQFDNGVPNFGTAQEAEQYIRDFGGVPSHPTDSSLTHGMTLFTSMDELQEYVFPKIYQLLETRCRHEDCRSAGAVSRAGEGDDAGTGTALEDSCRPQLWDAVEARLSWGIHAEMPVFEAVRNTFDYLYHHMKFGIFVMIQDSEVKIFAPFVNHREYKNTWWPWCDLQSEKDVHRYYQQKAHYLGMPLSKMGQYNSNTSEWWVNGNILCNWTNEDIWGDHFLFALKHMLAETCRHHPVPDCAFFVNKRDYPQVKFNLDRGVMVEPYGFMWNRNDKKPEADVDLPTGRQYEHLLPVLSFYTSNRFADLGMPCTEDWEAATGRVFPCTMLRSRIAKQDIRCRDLFALGRNHPATVIPWHHKRHTAFFRGTATGSGVSADTNSRIRLAQMDFEWNHPNTPVQGPPSAHRMLPPPFHTQVRSSSVSLAGYLDAKLTGWNLRDKKRPGERLSFVKKHQYLFRVNGVQNFVPLAAQAQYKYLIYVDGHCAACRFGYMMSLGSVILRVESECVADQMWYFHLLEPYRHFVPVKADLSDLREKIEWCRKHDAHCRAIAENARLFHRQYLSKESMMSYLYGVFSRIHSRILWPSAPINVLETVSTASTSTLATIFPHPPLNVVVQDIGGMGGDDDVVTAASVDDSPLEDEIVMTMTSPETKERDDELILEETVAEAPKPVTAALTTALTICGREGDVDSAPTTCESAASGFWSDSTLMTDGTSDPLPRERLCQSSSSPTNTPTSVKSMNVVVKRKMKVTTTDTKNKKMAVVTMVATSRTPVPLPAPPPQPPACSSSSLPLSSSSLSSSALVFAPIPAQDIRPSLRLQYVSDLMIPESVEKAMLELPCLSFDEPEEAPSVSVMPFEATQRKKVVVRVTPRATTVSTSPSFPTETP